MAGNKMIRVLGVLCVACLIDVFTTGHTKRKSNDPTDKIKVTTKEYFNVTLLCRPTLINLNVTLEKGDKLIDKRSKVSINKQQTHSFSVSGNYCCKTNNDDTSTRPRIFSVDSSFPVDETVRILTVRNVTPGLGVAQWIPLSVNYYSTSFLAWRSPGFANSSETYVKNDELINKLIITGLQPTDFGVYEIIAFNTKRALGIVVTLSVKDTSQKEYDDDGCKWFETVVIYVLIIMSLGVLAIGSFVCFKKRAQFGVHKQEYFLPYDKKFEIPKKKLKLGMLLGSGEFGVVFSAKADGIIDKNVTTTVAVKKAKPNADEFHLKALASELMIIIRLERHVNVASFLGVCAENKLNENMMIIIEHCRFGNILDFMKKHIDVFVNQVTADGHLNWKIESSPSNRRRRRRRRRNLCDENAPNNTNKTETSIDSSVETSDHTDCYLRKSSENNIIVEPSLCTHDLLFWSFQIARGMEYIASKNILHGDLAARNVLLAEKNIVKICDFDCAKSLDENGRYCHKKNSLKPIPFKWMAIESIRDGVFSSRSDVWAFGIVMWELFSLGRSLYRGKIAGLDLLNNLINGHRLEQPVYANSEIYNIMFKCWNIDANARPSFTDLGEQLGNLLHDDTKSHYIELLREYEKTNTLKSTSKDYLSNLRLC